LTTAYIPRNSETSSNFGPLNTSINEKTQNFSNKRIVSHKIDLGNKKKKKPQ